MAEFSAVLKRTIEGLGDSSPATRQRVYDKARQAIRAKLSTANPPLSADMTARQLKALEDAIETVEFDFRISDAVTIAAPAPARTSPFAAPKSLATPPPAAPVAPRAQPSPAPRPMTPAAARPASIPTPQASGPAYAPVREAEPPVESDEGERASTYAEAEAGPVLVRRRGGLPLALAAVAFLVIAGGGTAAWIYKDKVTGLLSASTAPETPKPATAPAGEPATDAAAEAAAPTKLTQRLTEEGTEVDEGPAQGPATVGEGTSVAAATSQTGETAPATAADTAGEAAPAAPVPAPETAAATAQPAPQQPAAADQPIAAQPAPAGVTVPGAPASDAIAVSQKAIFYEERTNAAQGSANAGNVVWSLVMESPGGDLPPEPAIRAEASVPERNLSLRMTIRRNGDKTLPASHIVELVMTGPENPASGPIDNVLRMTFKESEGAAGNPLFGVPAKIADGFFLIALTDSKAEIDANIALMKREQWIDIPFSYGSGRRALITIEKGIPGEKAFEEALKAWGEKASG